MGRGFTLIELLVVISVVAVFFFALRPTFGVVIQSSRERASVRRLAGLLSAARTEAVGRGQLVRVVCEARENLFWAEAQADPGSDRSYFEPLTLFGRDRLRLPDDLEIVEVVLGNQWEAALPRHDIYFYPDGRTDGATIGLLDRAGRQFFVKVAPATGRVTVDAERS